MKILERKGQCACCGDCCRGCDNLGDDNLCKVYDSRPDWCNQEYPRSWDKLNPKCGYWFEAREL